MAARPSCHPAGLNPSLAITVMSSLRSHSEERGISFNRLAISRRFLAAARNDIYFVTAVELHPPRTARPRFPHIGDGGDAMSSLG